MRILIVGGGAAGFFAAITAAEAAPEARVCLYEATAHPLAKVRISGGGRCNVTHACLEPRELVKRYPRGSRELLGPFTRFGPRDTIAWFAERGVTLKTEADGRMFPDTDDSATIVDCLRHAAEEAGVKIFTSMGVRGIAAATTSSQSMVDETPAAAGAEVPAAESGKTAPGCPGFDVTFTDDSVSHFDRVLLATGGNKSSIGLTIAEAFGHGIEPPVASLFTFHIDDPRLRGLEGVAVPGASTSVPGTKLAETGPLLVTHWGLSGPAILKLSAWGARELAACDYRFPLRISWTGGTQTEAFDALTYWRNAHPRKQLVNTNPFVMPSRLWERFIAAVPGLSPESQWAGISKDNLQKLAAQAAAADFTVEGKSLNKDEFVTCGGVRLREVDFKTMESRLQPGLHFAGELLDIDGITGGFNFQAAWTTGWLAGQALAAAANASAHHSDA
ncbi:flavoprotein [Verrucomicrobia bacterium IMCC26134]|jgi:predicted flavoprotein YhiN|nr:flavoprotein [Verrucomicrobia bacterium IMCC26134]